jgi:hypothetical protein
LGGWEAGWLEVGGWEAGKLGAGGWREKWNTYNNFQSYTVYFEDSRLIEPGPTIYMKRGILSE